MKLLHIRFPSLSSPYCLVLKDHFVSSAHNVRGQAAKQCVQLYLCTSITASVGRKLTVCIFPSISEMLSVTHTEDVASCLRIFAGLIPNLPEPAKIENFLPKIKSTYYKTNTTTEEGTTDVSATLFIICFHPFPKRGV